ncbi:ABC transporter permease [candidate division CSSED10-310 bacterium]|uniref:ABC transporter permease n=1 Tax=candidate division CSSED10-310 bacterium TaxID=2855610 RepID=A0ABV6YZS3_UNCC1
MKAFLIRRSLIAIPVIWGVITLVFLILRLIPGDPVEIMLGEQASTVDREQLRAELGLNKPFLTQYVDFFGDLAQGDVGTSITLYPGQQVATILWQRYPYTLELALISMVVAIVLAVPLGILSALKPQTALDQFSLTFSMLGVSIPNFWLGPLLIILFCYKWSWFPMPSQGGWQSIILPAVTLGSGMASILIRMTRTSYLDILSEQFMRTARAKGLSSCRLYLKHGLRNALNPIITIIGLQFGILLAGAVITETVFGWPGVGYLVIEAIRARDYPVVQGCIMIISFTYVIVNFFTDLLYTWADPRIQFG